MMPPAPCALYKVQQGPKDAMASFLAALAIRPGDVKAVWMLNIAAKSIAAAVPDEYAMPPFEAEADIGRFANVALKAGITYTNIAGGAAMDDFDGDGLLDVVTSNSDPAGSMQYWHNDGDGKFTERGAAAGLDGQLGGLNLVQTDYNNDGRPDIFVMRGGWMRDDGRQRNSLLRGNADGTFTDVTREAGLERPYRPVATCAWADFDVDGDLDVFLGNESEGPRFSAQLMRNNGDGTFTDVAESAGVTNGRYCKGVSAGDYDGDGRPDLYVSNFGDPNRLYHNEGGLRFRDVAREAGVTEPGPSFPTWFFDYDNDGRLDIFAAGYGRDIGYIACDRMGLPHDGPRMVLYRNRGDGTFEDVTKAVGLYRTHLAMGSSYGDFDNDGWQDLFLGTGFPSYDAYEPNVAYRNDGGRRFQDITASAGMGHLPKGHGVAFGDIDNDGDQDVFEELGGFFIGDVFFNTLFLNPGQGHYWITIRLSGERTNRAAIGTRVKVTTSSGRAIYSWVGTGGSFGGNSLQQEIGLGDESAAVTVEIGWMRSAPQVFTDVAPDAFYDLREGGELKRVDRPRVPLTP